MTPPGRAGCSSQQLHRAAAQRGKLDPLYQDLSDHWTRILQRLYPVWALIGPGLSDPGHIEIHSRQIYLDADALLGVARAAARRARWSARAVLRCFGVALHETFHAKHTKRWVLEHDLALADSEDPADRQLADDRRLLEEPRMEAHGVPRAPARQHPRTVRAPRPAGGGDRRHPRRASPSRSSRPPRPGQPVTRDMAGRATVYLQARTHYGARSTPPSSTACAPSGGRSLGEDDLRALDALFARVIWIADGELEALDKAAREYRAIIGPPDPPPATGDGPGDAQPRRRRRQTAATSQRARTRSTAGSLADALEQALDAGPRRASSSSSTRTSTCRQVLAQAADRGAQAPGARARRGDRARRSGRMPDRGVDRPPVADEVQQARRYATRLRQALTAGTRRVDKRTPGGRFDGRAYTRARAQRQSGRPVTHAPVADHPRR